jgi:transketolase
MYDFSHYTRHELAANTIRTLSMDAVQKANSGHPGTPMGLADVAVVLWREFMRHNPADPHWFNQDRFLLSAGHASMLLYSLLHLSGYELSLEDIKQFRQWGSKTPGHPENFKTEGIHTTTGPLGQGFGNAVGMAIAEKWLATHFNRPGYDVVDHYTYCIASDGDLMEGVSHEAASLAGHLRLGKLIVFYDDNRITIDGSTELAWSDDVEQRFRAYQWHTLQIDGHDVEAIQDALHAAQAEQERPTLIITRTHIGYGSPAKQDTASAHGEPLGEEEILRTKENLAWPVEEPFYVPEEVYEYMRPEDGAQEQEAWQSLMRDYAGAYPEDAALLQMAIDNELPDGWLETLPSFPASEKGMATRAASGKVLDALLPVIPWMIGGSADLTPSNQTKQAGIVRLAPGDFRGRYIHFGVREHAMGAVMNGMVLHGAVRPYGGTFLIFSDYMRPTIRLAAMIGAATTFVFTHDSIGLGEDGPTHQPIEHLPSLRAIPGLVTFRPADANETSYGWQAALQRHGGPTALILSRQGLPTLDREKVAPAAGALRGAYVLSDVDEPQAVIIGTGSEVHIALEAQQLLAGEGIAARVVSMPSWELFAEQPKEYQEAVLLPQISAKVAVEAAATLGWERYVGRQGRIIGLDRFGHSAPYKEIYEHLGITAAAVAGAVRELLELDGG